MPTVKHTTVFAVIVEVVSKNTRVFYSGYFGFNIIISPFIKRQIAIIEIIVDSSFSDCVDSIAHKLSDNFAQELFNKRLIFFRNMVKRLFIFGAIYLSHLIPLIILRVSLSNLNGLFFIYIPTHCFSYNQKYPIRLNAYHYAFHIIFSFFPLQSVILNLIKLFLSCSFIYEQIFYFFATK